MTRITGESANMVIMDEAQYGQLSSSATGSTYINPQMWHDIIIPANVRMTRTFEQEYYIGEMYGTPVLMKKEKITNWKKEMEGEKR